MLQTLDSKILAEINPTTYDLEFVAKSQNVITKLLDVDTFSLQSPVVEYRTIIKSPPLIRVTADASIGPMSGAEAAMLMVEGRLQKMELFKEDNGNNMLAAFTDLVGFDGTIALPGLDERAMWNLTLDFPKNAGPAYDVQEDHDGSGHMVVDYEAALSTPPNFDSFEARRAWEEAKVTSTLSQRFSLHCLFPPSSFLTL